LAVPDRPEPFVPLTDRAWRAEWAIDAIQSIVEDIDDSCRRPRLLRPADANSRRPLDLFKDGA
jgi:hypothetical protein